MAKDTIRNITLPLIFLITTFGIPSKIRHSFSSDDAKFLKLCCIILSHLSKKKGKTLL